MRSQRPWTRANRVRLFASFLLLATIDSSWAQGAEAITIPLQRVTDVRFSPDGRHLATLIRGERFVSNAGSIFDARTGALEARLRVSTPEASLLSLVWAPDSSRLATAYTTFKKGLLIYQDRGQYRRNSLYSIAIWDAKSGAQTHVFPYAPFYEYAFGYLDWARDGKLWGKGTPPALFEVKTGARLHRFGPPAVPGESEWSTYNHNHSLLAISRKNSGEIWVYEVPSGRLVRKWNERKSNSAFWGRDEDVLLFRWQGEVKTGGAPPHKTVRLVEARTGRALHLPPLNGIGPWGFVRKGQIALIDTRSHSSGRGAAGSKSWRLLVWDYRAKKVLWQNAYLATYRFPYLSVSPNGLRISALVQRQKLVRVVWDATSGREIWHREIKSSEQRMTWAPDSKRLAIYGGDTIQIYAIRD